MQAAPAIGFRYHASRLLLAAMLAMTLLALVAIWLSAAPGWLHLLLSGFVVACAGVAASNLLRPRVTTLLWRAEGDVDLGVAERRTRDQREAQGAVAAARIFGPLIVLTVRWPPRQRAHLWILPDNLDADARRRLRIRLGGPDGIAVASGNTDSG
jgi:toxin CptA